MFGWRIAKLSPLPWVFLWRLENWGQNFFWRELCSKRQNLWERLFLGREIDYHIWLWFSRFSRCLNRQQTNSFYNKNFLSYIKASILLLFLIVIHTIGPNYLYYLAPLMLLLSLFIFWNMDSLHPIPRLECVNYRYFLNQILNKFIDAKLKNIVLLWGREVEC